jgi:hypothetical protein
MHPTDTVAAEDAAWAAFVQALADHLAAQWPAMPERLGDRYPAFVDLAVQQGLKRGLSRAAAVARYVNLWFVWGPAFHDKPGFEWALGLLAAPKTLEWGTVHQLVQRSLAELQRLPDTRIAPQALADADARLVHTFGHLGTFGAMHPVEAAPTPLRACDLEAVELRLLEPAVAQHYALQGALWQRVDLPLPQPVRIDAARPAPRVIGVLSQAPGVLPQTRLQLRARAHAVCDGDVHPALDFCGSHGQWRWLGHETRAVSWPLATLEPPVPAAGAGTAIAEETSPDIFKLDLRVCGLRDQGDAMGAQGAQVWVWPASQWWLELQRTAADSQAVAPTHPVPVRGSTRCQLERDGSSVDSATMRVAFEDGLDAATGTALQALLRAWAAVPGLASPQLEGALALLSGRAAFTWGWQLGASGLEGRALLRLLGEMDMQACAADLHLQAELALHGARGRLTLRCVAAAALRASLRREAAEPPLLPVMQAAQMHFSLPFEADLVPFAADSGALLQAAGPCAGALVGEAGLRPRTSGGSGWEWFARLRVQAVSLPVVVVDPLLGSVVQTLALLPEQVLLDWRLG